MTKNLGSLIFILFLPAILLGQYCSVVAGDTELITKTCKQTPYYQLCVSTLQSDPRSSKADIPGLGLIIVAAVKAKVKNTLKLIKQLEGSNPRLKAPLSDCNQVYNAVVIADIPEAVEALTKGDPKFAENGMSDAAIEAQQCESGFKQSKSPLRKIDL
ncbi:hypothetical protein F0562_034939 [Nyssa sinensis]|uniref:Pectinesterase inhibitor domain-containing protein n=1 Tax=Nyssa sinensis TaxID=561372 RepID=A0A5J5AC65_9ASTE|nr:hypothetical protein F0562_034939 [Nyssa sinensis]